jgi:transcriptional regulator with XRE-family HTH domain
MEVTPATEALLAAQEARKRGLTQTEIAKAVGASQSQVSRLLAGHCQRHSKLLQRVCEYVFYSQKDRSISPQQSPALMEALAAVWDGTPQHAEALALVIRSLGGLTSTHPVATSKHRSQP